MTSAPCLVPLVRSASRRPCAPRRAPTDAALLGVALLALAACGGDGAGGGGARLVDDALAPVAGLEEIEAPPAAGSGEPNLFVAADGRALLSWFEEAGGGRHDLRFAALDPDAREWGPARTIVSGDDFFVNWADFPSMFELPDGTLAAHWPRRSGGGTYEYEVEVAWSHDGGESWSEPVVPHRDGTLSEHGFVSLFPWEGGRMGAVWLDGRGYAGWDEEAGAPLPGGPPDDPEMSLRFTPLAPDGLGAEALLDGRVCECCQTSAAVTSRGPVVVYRNRGPDEVRDTWIVRHVDGAWTEPAPVHEDGWEIRACPVNGPSVAAGGERVAVAWFTAAGDDPTVRVAFSADAGETFGPPIRVDDGDPAGRVQVLLLPEGEALVGWLERAGDEGEVRVRRVTPAGALGPSQVVAVTSPARASGFPRMARSGDRLVFAWTDTRAGGEGPRVRAALARLPGGAR